MRAVDRFEQRSKTVYNGQDVLKNHFLHGYPKHYTDDTMDYSIVEQYKDHYVKLIVVNKKDLYQFDRVTE